MLAHPLPTLDGMDDLKREMWLNEMVERVATLTYYLLFALGPALVFVVFSA
jgi:uncharacterized BrkB/YihY/UPF0761 family membrane protein